MVLKLDKETMDQLTVLIEEIVQEKISEKFEEVFGDPDIFLDLTDEAKSKIEESLSEYRSGKRGIPLEAFAKDMGIELE